MVPTVRCRKNIKHASSMAKWDTTTPVKRCDEVVGTRHERVQKIEARNPLPVLSSRQPNYRMARQPNYRMADHAPPLRHAGEVRNQEGKNEGRAPNTRRFSGRSPRRWSILTCPQTQQSQ